VSTVIWHNETIVRYYKDLPRLKMSGLLPPRPPLPLRTAGQSLGTSSFNFGPTSTLSLSPNPQASATNLTPLSTLVPPPLGTIANAMASSSQATGTVSTANIPAPDIPPVDVASVPPPLPGTLGAQFTQPPTRPETNPETAEIQPLQAVSAIQPLQAVSAIQPLQAVSAIQSQSVQPPVIQPLKAVPALSLGGQGQQYLQPQPNQQYSQLQPSQQYSQLQSVQVQQPWQTQTQTQTERTIPEELEIGIVGDGNPTLEYADHYQYADAKGKLLPTFIFLPAHDGERYVAKNGQIYVKPSLHDFIRGVVAGINFFNIESAANTDLATAPYSPKVFYNGGQVLINGNNQDQEVLGEISITFMPNSKYRRDLQVTVPYYQGLKYVITHYYGRANATQMFVAR
jgi:hypothetical protein